VEGILRFYCSTIWSSKCFWQIVTALEKSEAHDSDDDPFFSADSSPVATSVSASLSSTPKSQNPLKSPTSPISSSFATLTLFSDHPGNISYRTTEVTEQTASGQRPRLQPAKLSRASLRDQLRNVTGAHTSPERKDNMMNKEKSNSAVDDLLLVKSAFEKLLACKSYLSIESAVKFKLW
jgi:hypothetical protein